MAHGFPLPLFVDLKTLCGPRGAELLGKLTEKQLAQYDAIGPMLQPKDRAALAGVVGKARDALRARPARAPEAEEAAPRRRER